MSTFLQIASQDPIIARDGRPFGAGQGNRMRGMPWPLPSVVAGSFRTTLVKANPTLEFNEDVINQLKQIAVAGLFPVCDSKQLYLPAPNDCVAEPNQDGKGIKRVHRVSPDETFSGGCDLPEGLKPVMLPADVGDFKPTEIPAWWPVGELEKWLLRKDVTFDTCFLKSPVQETRDHVKIDPNLGAAEDGQIFSTTGLNVLHMPKFGAERSGKFEDRFAEVTLSVRVDNNDSQLNYNREINIWHPLGGERRLVCWQKQTSEIQGWNCSDKIRDALGSATRVRMILATPAIFEQGWKPDLQSGLFRECGLTLVGACVGRWKAVSGWSLAPPRGPKAIRRMAPAGSVYFFEVKQGAAKKLADLWLQSVSDNEQERRDGFGLALWGTW